MNKNKSFYESFKRIAFTFCAVLLGIFGVANAANLPAGYTELEYIQSSGKEYIDTNIKSTADTFYTLEVEFASKGNGYRFFGNSSSGVLSGFGASSNTLYVNSGDTPVVGNITPLYGTKMVIDYSGTNVNINGTNYECERAVANDNKIYINARGDSLTTRVGAGKWYRVKIGSGTTLQGEFVPARRVSDGVLGMYDTVSGQFFTNAGTGTFTAGPVVLDPCRNLADMTVSNIDIGHYISSSGVYSESTSNFIYTPFIPVQPNTTYTLSWGDMELYFVTISEYSAANDAGFIIRKTGTTGGNYNLTITTGATTHYVRFGSNLYGNSNTVTLAQVQALTWQFEQGSTATIYVPYCASTGAIQIATTKYNEDAFANLVTTLNSAITKVTNIVDTTVAQASSIGTLATTKQDRPADGDCPAGRKCLLVTGTDGKPHWYLIQE